MRKPYKILKMKSGEEIIAGVTRTRDGSYKLHRPMVFKTMVSHDMFGGMFAGTDEAAGESTEDGKVFYGMSSAEAMNKHSGGVAAYRAAEGKRVVVPHIGSVDGVMQ